MRISVVDWLMAGYSSASWAIGVLCNGCITKDTPPPFNLPSTTFGYTPILSRKRIDNDGPKSACQSANFQMTRWVRTISAARTA